MKTRSFRSRAAFAGALVVAVAVAAGCGSGENATPDRAVERATEESASASNETTGGAAGRRTKLANPRRGVCPVDDKRATYEYFVTVDGKNYVLCSEECQKKMEEDGPAYIAAANERLAKLRQGMRESRDHDHEGHDH